MIERKHAWWDQVRQLLGQETDLSNFKNWDVVRKIPLYRDNEFHGEYGDDIIDMLNVSPWKNEWVEVIKLNEPKTGHTDESWQKAQTVLDVIPTTGVVLKNMHHILTYEQLREKSIIEYENIVELGAGIGELARLIFARGFQGNYYVVDFPEVSRLSYYNNEGKTISLETINELPDEVTGKNTLFIATWSLSETPFEYRDEVGKRLRGCDSLILSQNHFQEIDKNILYFLKEWPMVNDCFYRIRQLEFHTGDGGNMYIICCPAPANKAQTRPKKKKALTSVA